MIRHSSSGKTLRGLNIGILLCDRSNPFWVENARKYEELASSFGFHGDMVFPEPEGNPDSQLNEMRRMLERGYDALVINPLTATNLVPAILKASKKGIPVFDVGGKSRLESGCESPRMYVPVHTVDFYEQGRIGGEYLARLMEKNGESVAAIIGGRPGTVHSDKRCQGAEEAIKGHGKSVVVKSAYFERERAREIVCTLLEEQAELGAFFCANDMMALGAADVCSLRGVCASIVGVDGIPEAIDAVRHGIISGTVAFSPRSVACCAAMAMAAFFDGKPCRHPDGIGSFLVSGDNIGSCGL